MDISEAVELRCNTSHPIESPDFQEVSLGRPDGGELEPFHGILDVLSAEKADQISLDIADHLQLPPSFTTVTLRSADNHRRVFHESNQARVLVRNHRRRHRILPSGIRKKSRSRVPRSERMVD